MLAIAENKDRYRIYMVEVILSLPLGEEDEEDTDILEIVYYTIVLSQPVTQKEAPNKSESHDM